MNHGRKLGALVAATVALAPLVLVPDAVAGSATIELTASTAIVDFHEDVTVSGNVTGDATCVGPRQILLQWRPALSVSFATVATGTTAAGGAFSFAQSQEHSGAYRVQLPAVGGCAEATSGEALVGVRALVHATLVVGSNVAGSCADLTVVVSPPKAGQTVDVLKRDGGAWTIVETLTLDAISFAQTQLCVPANDIGVARFRVRWRAQDPLNETSTSRMLTFEVVKPKWIEQIDEAIGRRHVSVAVAEQGAFLYRHADAASRIPASTEKLLLAMASLDTFGPEHRIVTRVGAEGFRGGVVRGNLWILGRGDPFVDRRSMRAIAVQLVEAGVRRVTGRVMGSTSFFRHDWDAPGWNKVARDYVNRPTALTFESNHDPVAEREAADALMKLLERRAVQVAGRPGAGSPPPGLEFIAEIESDELQRLLATTLRSSWNFAAEVLGKGLGAEVRGRPGTIAKGAATIEGWAAHRGVRITAMDSSGLSYDNRVTAAGLVELLGQSEEETWGDDLRLALPRGGQGTLEHRLREVSVRAKTGTLEDVSALSGWVYAERLNAWVEFSILGSRISKSTAIHLEDRIVKILAEHAR
ncbi:MAG TPA: D-alanyl-D-alanine carboxypeptidase [Actinomycetota bacterium]|jgi:D-alanyl-D-alanine carboxypeptidase/D-alanyl-D-alanine-endopeptidase (penicillin-binding protein 4)|nr:D-alanyl-D-alanine carboxypeptidase [Actinomycetota bacterium]